jgi:predicted ATPase
MSLLVLLKQMTEKEGQFVVATHSPILMAYPGSTILSMDGGEIEPAAYEDLDHVRIMRGFLNHPQRYLDRLLG